VRLLPFIPSHGHCLWIHSVDRCQAGRMDMTLALGIVGAAFALALVLTPRSADAQLTAGADFQCISPQTIPAGTPISFQPGGQGVNFGSVITLGPSGQSFALSRAGIYHIHLEPAYFNGPAGTPGVQAFLKGIGPVALWPPATAGDRLISAKANDVLTLVPTNSAIALADQGSCELVIMQVQSAPPPQRPPRFRPAPPIELPSTFWWSRHLDN